MKLLTAFARWIAAVVSTWYGWVGASATAGLVGFGQGLGWWESPGKRTYVVLLVIGFIISVFGAWHKQYMIAEEALGKVYDGRPIIVLEILGQPSASKTNPLPESKYDAPVFGLHNCGNRTARFVNIEPLKSILGDHSIHFQSLVSLEPGQHCPISFAVDDTRRADAELTWKFLHDNPLESALVWYDTKINFRDAGESAMAETVRLAFDVETEYLYTTAVPYTQRAPEKPVELAGRPWFKLRR